MIVLDCYSYGVHQTPSPVKFPRFFVSNEAVESRSHRATLQCYNYLLLSLIIARLFLAFRLLEYMVLIWNGGQLYCHKNVLISMVKPINHVIVYSKCSGLYLIACSTASVHTFPYSGQA